MNKKYLSVILFGALMLGTTGTFTSCKDYDDDINNLQSQIDKLATKEDMEAKLSQMQSAINDAKATAEEALKAAQEAGDAEEIAKLEARVKALEDAAIDVDALKKEIADSVHISESSALQLFRQGIHRSPVAYLIQYRIKRAADLLVNTNKTVTNIAYETGFSDAGYFCRTFRKYYRRTAMCYRKHFASDQAKSL